MAIISTASWQWYLWHQYKPGLLYTIYTFPWTKVGLDIRKSPHEVINEHIDSSVVTGLA